MESHDYVIVGAGSAGCVLANRLSENPAISVLLLEAGGPDRHWKIHVPAAFAQLFKGANDWGYETEPEPQLNGRRLYWPRGKVLGGSSSINAMIYIRGHRRDYDEWERLGNPGWSFADVLPYFRRAEDNARCTGEYHGQGGLLPVTDLLCPNPLSRLFLEACAEVGLRPNDDFNGPEQDGAGFYQVTQRAGRRASAAAAYLAPARQRKNLEVETGAHVTRVIIDQGRALGVEYHTRVGRPAALANREVILCGGAVNSPQLLMLSGVGPARHLHELGLPVVHDLPGVGGNLQDHFMAGVNCACNDRGSLDSAPNLRDLVQYLFRKRGRLTSNVGEAGAFLRTSEGLDVPDVQLHFAPAFFVQHGFVRPKGAGYSVGATVLRPTSRGSIRLRSQDPRTPPAIRANYYADPADLATQLAALKLVRQLVHAKAFGKVRLREHLPGADARDDAALTGHLRETTETLYHPVGTCKMGRDPLAVVDHRLKVHGVERLRVVDASVMPTLVGGNTNAPTIMIAEKAADMILGRSAMGELPA